MKRKAYLCFRRKDDIAGGSSDDMRVQDSQLAAGISVVVSEDTNNGRGPLDGVFAASYEECFRQGRIASAPDERNPTFGGECNAPPTD